jgi:hypothetical protein
MNGICGSPAPMHQTNFGSISCIDKTIFVHQVDRTFYWDIWSAREGLDKAFLVQILAGMAEKWTSPQTMPHILSEVYNAVLEGHPSPADVTMDDTGVVME